MKNPIEKLVGILSSNGLTFVILILLFALTLAGTMAQVDQGLFASQKKYFDSLWLIHHIGPIAVPMPGGVALIGLLALNLAVGGLVRLRKGWRTAGIFVTHIGVALMLLAGAVKLWMSDDGHLTLYEGERCGEYESYYHWEIAITHAIGDGQLRELVIPQDEFAGLSKGSNVTFRSADLPFDLVLSHFMRNCFPQRKGPMFEVAVPVVDGFYLKNEPSRKEAEGDMAGIYATLAHKSGGRRETGILWGWSGSASSTSWRPLVLKVGDVDYAIELRHVRYPMPFTIKLDDFHMATHPGTMMASTYESKVTKMQGDVVAPVLIKMNDPLRHTGFVLFQSGYGPPDARPGQRMYSKFSVVRNPSDQWPLYSCIVIGLGLFIHFVLKFVLYVMSQSRRAAA